MLRFVTAICALLLSSLIAACVIEAPPAGPELTPAREQLRLASTDWPPFTGEVGQPRVANELVDEALDAVDVDVQEQIMAPQAWLDALLAGRVDGSAAAWWSEEREAELLYSRPYLENRLVLIGRADADMSPTSFAELADKRVAIVAGYAYGPELDDANGPIFVAMSDTPENIRALLAGDVDYVLADALLAAHSLVSHPRSAELRVGEHALMSRTLHFVIRKEHPGAERIVASFNAQITEMMRVGTYNRILGLDWIEADADGDGRLDLIFGGEARLGTEAPQRGYRVVEPEGPRVKVEAQPDQYYINGQRHDGWDSVPDDLKTESTAPTVGIGIRW